MIKCFKTVLKQQQYGKFIYIEHYTHYRLFITYYELL